MTSNKSFSEENNFSSTFSQKRYSFLSKIATFWHEQKSYSQVALHLVLFNLLFAKHEDEILDDEILGLRFVGLFTLSLVVMPFSFQFVGLTAAWGIYFLLAPFIFSRFIGHRARGSSLWNVIFWCSYLLAGTFILVAS